HAALSDLAVDPQVRLVQAQHVLDDGQAQAGTAALARAAGRDAVEAFGQARQVRGGNAVAAVAHREYSAAVVAARQAQFDAAAGRGVTHRIADQVGERAVQFAGRSPEVDARVVHHLDRVPAL